MTKHTKKSRGLRLSDLNNASRLQDIKVACVQCGEDCSHSEYLKDSLCQQCGANAKKVPDSAEIEPEENK
jgi:hypothetical protein